VTRALGDAITERRFRARGPTAPRKGSADRHVLRIRVLGGVVNECRYADWPAALIIRASQAAALRLLRTGPGGYAVAARRW